MNSCMKKNIYSPEYNKWMYRWMKSFADVTDIHPNVWTGMNIFIDCIFIYLLVQNKLTCGSLILIMLLHTFLDFFDGCVARAQQKYSTLGARLDNISDLCYYIPLYIYVFMCIFKKQQYMLGGIGMIILSIALIIFSHRFRSFTNAIDYISMMFEIDKDKIPHIHTDTAPFYDFLILLSILYVIPFLIIT